MNRTGIALLVATLALGLSLSAVAAPVPTPITVYQGWNMIGFPTVPLAPGPADVFITYGAQGMTGGDAVEYNLFRYDPIARSLRPWNLDAAGWGNILIGDGYWLYRTDAASATFSYQGVDVSGDHWLSLPRAGWTLVGYPNNTPTSVNYEDLLVTNGIVTKSIVDAIDEGWLSETAFNYNNAARSLQPIGVDAVRTTLEKNKGYWFYTYQDNLALIVPGA